MLNLDFYTEYEYNDLDTFASSLKHKLKLYKPSDFLSCYADKPDIKDNTKMLYLVSMIEYVCNIGNLKHPNWIVDYKDKKLDKILFSEGAMLFYNVTGLQSKLTEDYNKSINEFKNHNIIETSVIDVF